MEAKYENLWKEDADAGRIRLWGEVEHENAGLIAAILAKLEANKNFTKATLYINSNGGSGFAMWALTDAIRSSRLEVTTIVEGFAASAACIIAAAGQVRNARPNSQFLFHGASHYIGWEKSREATQDAEWAQAFDEQMVAFMAEQTRKPKAFWRKAIRDSAELRFTVADALEWGVIHEVV